MITDSLIERVAKHEGFSSRAYRDSKDFLTVGYGHTIGRLPDLTNEGRGLTEPQARRILRDDLHAADVQLWTDEQTRRIYGSLDLHRAGVLIEMAFQLGFAGLLGFRRMWAALETGDFRRAAEEMLDSRWAKQTPQRARRLAAIMRTG